MKALLTSLLIVGVSFTTSIAWASPTLKVSKQCQDIADEALGLIEEGKQNGNKDCIAADADDTNDPVLFQKCTQFSEEKMALARKCEKEVSDAEAGQ